DGQGSRGTLPSRDAGEGTRADVRLLRGSSRRGALLVRALPRERDPAALRLPRHAAAHRAPRSARVMGDSPATLAALGFVGLVGYLVGSISSGYIVGRIYRNVDLRNVGSGSTGATNTFRTLGTGAGLLVAIFDILKGSLAVAFAQLVFPEGSGGRSMAGSTS